MELKKQLVFRLITAIIDRAIPEISANPISAYPTLFCSSSHLETRLLPLAARKGGPERRVSGQGACLNLPPLWGLREIVFSTASDAPAGVGVLE